jgi:LuxR family transcriptional regulator, quorum-sensing system regulator SolR
MQLPVNFDSATLDGMLSHWLGALHEFAVEGVIILGPDPYGGPDDRRVLASHPPSIADAAAELALSRDFGAGWRASDAPLVAWQHIAKNDPRTPSRWRSLLRDRKLKTLVRVEFPLPGARAFECFLLSPREFESRADAALLVWSALSIWPMVKRAVAQAHCPLNETEIRCLELAFDGMTAKEVAGAMESRERTVNYHVAQAMGKLNVDNKMAAIQRACWFGAI